LDFKKDYLKVKRFMNLPIKKDEITIVIPTLNEEYGVREVIRELKEEGYYNILVLDGYSEDMTVKIAKESGAKTILQQGNGKAAAIKTAIDYVETKYMLVMDGDYTYDPKEISKFLPHMESYDEIIGSRNIGRENIPKFNRFGNWLITKTFNVLLGANLTDVCSGMYMLRTESLKKLDFKTKGFDIEVEIAAQLVSNGQVTEVPISYRKRIGEQKLSGIKHGPQILNSVLKLASVNNPVFLFTTIALLAFFPAILLLGWVAANFFFSNIWYEYYLILGITLTLFASQAFTISTISLSLKRMEKRVIKKLKIELE
jgi:dolichol-phosphate mannosyltransferase